MSSSSSGGLGRSYTVRLSLATRPGDDGLATVLFAPATAVAVDASHYLTATVTANDGAAGSDSSAVASLTTNSSGGTALVLKTTRNLTVTQRQTFTFPNQLKIATTKTGNGQIFDGTFSFAFEKQN